MIEVIKNLISKYKNKGILVDTNLLLLLFIGSFDPCLITKFKRTNIFVEEDFNILQKILKSFENIITTPNILTETCNLSGQLPGPIKKGYFDLFARGINILGEHYIPSSDISKMLEFKKFGLTDAVIINFVRDKYLVITVDFPLSQYLQKKGIDAINFNHIRPYFWKK